MSIKLFSGLIAGIALVASTIASATPNADCCDLQLACCRPGGPCCTTDAKPACCAKAMACCAADKACCTAAPSTVCCTTGKACCAQVKPCCSAKLAAGANGILSVKSSTLESEAENE